MAGSDSGPTGMPVFAQAHEVDTWGHGHTRRFYAAASGCSQFKVTVIIKGFGESLTMDLTISIPYCIHYALEHSSFLFLSCQCLHGDSIKFD